MNILKTIFSEWEEGHEITISTIMKTRGSTYRKTGAQLVINENGTCFGQISGGCFESNLTEYSQALMRNKRDFVIVDYPSLSDPDHVFQVDSGCGGDITVLIESLSWLKPYADILNRALEEGKTILTAIILDHPKQEGLIGKHILFIEGQFLICSAELTWLQHTLVDQFEKQELRTGYLHDEDSGINVFCQVYPKLKHLLVAGTGKDAISLCQMALLQGYRVHVLDFRPSGLNAFSGLKGNIVSYFVDRKEAQISEVMATFHLTTPVVLMSHHLEFDILVLHCAQQYGFHYIGVLGSKHRTDLLLKSSNSEWSQSIHSPVGLNIGAESPEEISLSIMAQIVAIT